MKRLSKFISNHYIFIVLVAIALIIPAIIGYMNTRINYDILVYLPKENETIKGQDILQEDFGLGGYAFVMIDNMSNYDLLKLEKKINEIDGVKDVLSIADVIGTTIPKEMLPDKVKDKLYKDNETIMVVTFTEGTSEDKTLDAFKKLRETVGDSTKVSGMTALVLDTAEISKSEMLIYIFIAVILCMVVLTIATDSFVIPFLLLGNIGVAILYNMGSNIFLGQISYITQAITAVLQLGVTTDFSIFLYHKYEEQKENGKNSKDAMEIAIRETFKSVIGSSLTTIAGFLALCTMSFTLGVDIGLVMAKGVLCGVICVLTVFPAFILCFDKLIDKTRHKVILPKFKKLQEFSFKHFKIITLLFIILLIPALYGYKNYKVYYKLDDSLPDDMAFKVANATLSDDFNIITPEIAIIDKKIDSKQIEDMIEEIKRVGGIDAAVGVNSINNIGIPSFMLDDKINKVLKNDKYQLVVINSKYELATNELSNQIDKVKSIIKKYDGNAILAGQGPLMKDLVQIADHDFNMVNYTSLAVIFIIMIFALQSIGLPIILILAIEFAIFINMAFAFYTNTTLPFIAPIVVGTIQLGATIDYAILMSNKYIEERKKHEKEEAIKNTLEATVPSIIISALCFFAATAGVGIYTKIDMIGSICILLSRGAIISMFVVILLVPALLRIFDKFIMKTTRVKGVD